MKVVLDIRKGVEENAGLYFEKAKKAKKKLAGAEKALLESQEKLMKAPKAQEEQVVKPKLQKEWFEKFRWFYSSEGSLCVGGRDATTNEIVIKKHCDKGDIVFHTELAGSPFFVVKTEGKKVGEGTLKEAAIATASYSRAWKLGLQTAEVFYVNPDQLSKKPRSGEYIAKGAFMIYGKKNIIPAEVGVAVGITKDGKVMGGPVEALKANCTSFVKVLQGNEKASDVAKKIRKIIGGEVDDIIRALPSGGVKTL
ncbi:DUF814 domain-containing protein [Candidatus Woesearchaeota archaeon]|nr:DUF814 domain-containing protein [Candidatus Woesearchaeota archaeon]